MTPSMTSRLRALVATALAPLCLAASARPAAAGDVDRAARLFADGRAAVDRGDLDQGCAALAESLKDDARVGTAGKLAECEEKRGHLAAARARWQEACDLARTTNDGRRGAAESQLARLERTVPRLVLRTSKMVANESIRLDARILGDAERAGPIAVDPGEHVLEASAPGFAPWSSRVQLAADGSVTPVDFPSLAPSPHDDAAASAPAPPREASPAMAPGAPSASSAFRTGSIVATGAGIVALGVGGVFLGQAVSLNSRSNGPGGCVGNTCASAHADAQRRDAYADGNWATGLFIGGGALVAAGAALWIFAPGRGRSATGGLHVAPFAGARSAGVFVGGAFQ